MLKSPQLEQFKGRVSDSGEGRWTIAAAIDEGVPAHVLTSALFERFSSRGEADFGNKVCRRCAMSSADTTSKKPPNSSLFMSSKLKSTGHAIQCTCALSLLLIGPVPMSPDKSCP